MDLPPVAATIVRVVEAIPDFDLDNDSAPGRFPQEALEPRPICLIPPVQIIFSIFPLLVRIDLEALILPVAHRVANHVASATRQTVELSYKLFLRPLKQVIVIASPQ
jgi:hypothetical protein